MIGKALAQGDIPFEEGCASTSRSMIGRTLALATAGFTILWFELKGVTDKPC